MSECWRLLVADTTLQLAAENAHFYDQAVNDIKRLGCGGVLGASSLFTFFFVMLFVCVRVCVCVLQVS